LSTWTVAHLLQRLSRMALQVRQKLAELKSEWDDARRRHPRLIIGVAGAFVLVAVLSVAGGTTFLTGLRDGLPELEALRRIGDMDQATSVFDDTDQLAFTIFKEQRIEVPLSEVSPNLTKALIAVEDQRFYEHRGFDLVRIASAAMANVRQQRKAQGASTITQQLARLSFLTPNKSYRRKFQELILAARIERMYSKPEILELYLNKVYFGDGLHGVEAASRGYFGKHASELTVPEAALLAGLVKSPSNYAPTVSMERALNRRNLVLQAMLDSRGINREEWKSARATKVVLRDTLRSIEPHGQYFKEQVRLELVERFGWQRVYQGGLRVFTTLNMPMQLAAESAVAEQLKVIDAKRAAWQARRAAARLSSKSKTPARPEPADVLQAALIALEPRSGHVRAMVGGRNFDGSRFNRAVQADRQPGSAFKPFVYATALEAGYSPATIIDHLDDPIATGQGAWKPADGHSTAGAMSLRTGLRTSSNRAAVRLLQEVGIGRTVQYARIMGVGDVPSVPSLALGSGEVTLQAMTAAYAAFANKGRVPRPMLIRRVEDEDGRLLYAGQESAVSAVSETSAFLMSTMLADVINAGTGNAARRIGFTLPAAGKTGTTNDFNDAWFIGYTPKLVAGVWVGFDQPRTILPNGFAGDVAVPMWAHFMKAATRNDKPEWFTPPYGVTTESVCRLSGKLASEGCEDVEVVGKDGVLTRRSMVYTEYFDRGTEPTAYCDQHVSQGIIGHIAGFFGGGAAAPQPPRPEDLSVVPAVVGTSGVVVPAVAATTGEVHRAEVQRIENPPQPPVKKRGFWSKIFRAGNNGANDEGHQNDRSERATQSKKKSGG
jgi:1A family penicillin-binding protein